MTDAVGVDPGSTPAMEHGPPPMDIRILPPMGLPFVAVAVVFVLYAIGSNSIWALMLAHVAGGGRRGFQVAGREPNRQGRQARKIEEHVAVELGRGHAWNPSHRGSKTHRARSGTMKRGTGASAHKLLS